MFLSFDYFIFEIHLFCDVIVSSRKLYMKKFVLIYLGSRNIGDQSKDFVCSQPRFGQSGEDEFEMKDSVVSEIVSALSKVI